MNKSRPVQKYLFILLLAYAFDIETNPGPRFPCGACTKAVTWKHKAICCDSCDVWFHINCQGIHSNAYRFLDASNISWECIQCGMPNFSTSLFNSTYSIELENQYSNLSNCSELSSPGLPKATSSPNKETKLKPDKNEHKKKIGNQVRKPIKIININFQSICNKKNRPPRNY